MERRACDDGVAQLCAALFSSGVILVFLVAYARQVQAMQALQTSVFFILPAIATIWARIRYAKLSDSRGALAALLLSLLLLCFFHKTARRFSSLRGGFMAWATRWSCPRSITLNVEAILSAPHKRSDVVNVTFFCLMDAGMLLSATRIGNLVDHAATLCAGYQNARSHCMAVAVASMLLSLLHFKKRSEMRRKRHVDGRRPDSRLIRSALRSRSPQSLGPKVRLRPTASARPPCTQGGGRIPGAVQAWP